MVKDENDHSDKSRAAQGCRAGRGELYTIAAATRFDFGGKNLTAYGGLFPVATMLENPWTTIPGDGLRTFPTPFGWLAVLHLKVAT